VIPSSPIPTGFVPSQRSKKAKAYLYPDEEAALMACRSIPLVARVAFGVLAREGEWAKYIHGNHGEGTFTFFGGHDPEDPEHQIGDPPTDLDLHPNSPGYRLILNNVLFPAAKKKQLKT